MNYDRKMTWKVKKFNATSKKEKYVINNKPKNKLELIHTTNVEQEWGILKLCISENTETVLEVEIGRR